MTDLIFKGTVDEIDVGKIAAEMPCRIKVGALPDAPVTGRLSRIAPQAKKDAEIEVARARGAAQAQEIVRSTLSSSYLHYLWIKTLNENPNVIYVATEANMPIFKNVK